jgi:hypothetical protein
VTKLQEKLDEDTKVAINGGLCLLFVSILVLLSNQSKIIVGNRGMRGDKRYIKVELEIVYQRNILPYNTLQ